MMRKYSMLLVFILLSVIYTGYAIAASPQKEEATYVANFNYTPDSKAAPGSAGVTLAIGGVFYQSNSKSPWDHSPQFENLDKALKEDLIKILSAKGFLVRGPFDSYDLIPYQDKKAIDLYLIPTLELSITSKGPNGDDLKAVQEKGAILGVIKVSGKLIVHLREVVTGELMWGKSIPFTTFTFLCKNKLPWAREGFEMAKMERGIEQPVDNRDLTTMNEVAKGFEKQYPDLMATISKLIDPEEMRMVKKQCQELKSKKGY